jgi:4-diphosphocytidyl-2-C-methyl-D-erythritol kinase
MASVSIYDHLRFAPRADSRICLTVDLPQRGSLPSETDAIPTNQSNLVQRSLELVRTLAQDELGSDSCSTGIDVHLRKNIPSAAGLGGASSDAAATLIAANRIWGLRWPLTKLAGIAAQLGSDIPFFLTGGTALCRGRGEIVQTLRVPTGLAIVIAKPTESLSTARVFRKVQLPGRPRKSANLAQSVRLGRPQAIGKLMFNRLQQFAEPLTCQIATLRREFNRLCCLGHQMSGSGSSYFGVFANARVALLAANCLSSRLPSVRIFCVQTLGPMHELSTS